MIRLAVLIGLCATLPGCRGPLGPPVVHPAADTDPVDGPLVIVGDIQRTSIAEQAFGRESNPAARRRLATAIGAVRPAAIVVVGDLVFDGASAIDWVWFERVFAPAVVGRPSVHVALGNHDYWGSDAAALHHLRRRFPALRARTYYVRRHGPLALVMLDSNEASLGAEEWARQSAWLHRTIYALESDPTVRGTLVFAHHPPFTNSDVTGDEAHVQRAFLPGFERAQKTLAFFSGHAHTYERYEKRGKHYVVTGGGGGPRVMGRDVSSEHADRVEGPYPRPFHFVRVDVDAERLALTVIGFDRDERMPRTIDAFAIPLPRHRAATGG